MRSEASYVLDYVNRILVGIASGVVVYIALISFTFDSRFGLAGIGLSLILALFAPFLAAAIGTAAVLFISLYALLDILTVVTPPPSGLISLLILMAIATIFSLAIPFYAYIRSRTTGHLLTGTTVFYANSLLLSASLVDMARSHGLELPEIPSNYSTYVGLLLALSLAGHVHPARNESVKTSSVVLTLLTYVSLLAYIKFNIAYLTPLFFIIFGIILFSVTMIFANTNSEYLIISSGVTDLVSAIPFGLGLQLSGIVSSPLALIIGGAMGLVEVISVVLYNRAIALINQRKIAIEERTLVMERIRNTIDSIEKLEDKINVPILSSSKDIVDFLENTKVEAENLMTELLKCDPKNVECTRTISSRLDTIKKEIEVRVNSYLFTVISENNKAVDFLKRYGILANPIEVIKSDVPFDQLRSYTNSVVENIIKNTNVILYTINNMNSKLNELVGKSLTEKPPIGLKLSDVEKLIDEGRLKQINESLDMCLRSARAIADILLDSKTKVEVSGMISQVSLLPISYEKVVNSYNALKKLKDELRKDLDYMEKTLDELLKYMKTEQMKVRIEAVSESKAFLDSNLPMCERINKVFIFIPQLTDAYNVVKNKDSITSLAQLVSVALPVLEAKGSVSIDELGISPDFVPYVLEILWSKGVDARTEKGNIVIISSYLNKPS